MAVLNALDTAGCGHATERPRTAHRRGRLVLASMVVALGIGSCQLPKPPIPKLQAGGAGRVSVVVAALDPVALRAGPG